MTTEATLLLRKQELERRTKDLPLEVANWRNRVSNIVDMNIHWSQMEAIGRLMGAYTDAQNQILAQFPNPDNMTAMEDALFKLLNAIVASQRAWNFFRSKFELRTVDSFKRNLRIADIVAIDCYDSVMNAAKAAGYLSAQEAREPPLTYLGAELSPMTWVRGARPNDGMREELLGRTLPIPVIELPFDHLSNVWEFLSIPHEVGHEIDADLNLLRAAKDNLATAWVQHPEIPPERQRRWAGWLSEILADMLALQLCGPAFAEMLMHVLLLPRLSVCKIVLGDAHPNHFLRMLIATGYIRTMASSATDTQFAGHLMADADEMEAIWRGIYGNPPDLSPYVDDISILIAAIMDSPLVPLRGTTLRELVPYTQAQDRNIREASELIRRGMPITFAITSRHLVSAARLAVKRWALDGSVESELPPLIEAVQRAVEARAPRGLRAGMDNLATSEVAKSARFKAFVIKDLAVPVTAFVPENQ